MTIPALFKFVNWITGTPVPIDDAITSALSPTIDTNLQNALFANIPVLAPGCRINIEPGNSAQGGNVIGSSTVYYNVYLHSWAPFNNGTTWVWKSIGNSGISQALSDATKSPAAAVASTVYDMYLWEDTDGTKRHTRGPAWTDSGAGTGTRGTAAALLRDPATGFLVNNVDITNGPRAGRGLFTGTIWVNSHGTLDGPSQLSGSGGVECNMCYANYYNRIPWQVTNIDNGVAYNYSSATVRQARGSANNQIGWVNHGQASSNMKYDYMFIYDINLVAAIGANLSFGCGRNQNTAFNFGNQTILSNPQGVNTLRYRSDSYSSNIQGNQIGYNYLAMLEQGDGTNANTFLGGFLQTMSIQY